MNKFLILFFIVFQFSFAQTPGTIYQRVQGELGQKVLDPNNDGFVSVSATGFSGIDFGAQSELRMVALPVINNEPHSDLSTGSNGGHTDIVSGVTASRESAYVLYKIVDGVPYVIFRMRIGRNSTSPKGYSFLLNTDGIYTGSGNNPGFDREVVFESPNNIRVYCHSGCSGGATGVVLNTFNATEYSQRSIALTTTNGDADYFYDFFIPFSALNISSQPIGITAATITSAQSGITGTISDFNGIDDRLYGNNRTLIMNALITSFPAIPLTQLTEDFNYSTWNSVTLSKTSTPIISTNLTTSSTTVSGTCAEANGTEITIYNTRNGVTSVLGTTTVINNSWSYTFPASSLATGDLISATALASGKTMSDFSANKMVFGTTSSSCYRVPPEITGGTNGAIAINITWNDPSYTVGQPFSVSVWRVSNNTYTPINADNTTFTQNSFSFVVGTTGNSQGTYAAKVTYNGCQSDFSAITTIGSNSVTTSATNAPTILSPQTNQPISTIIESVNNQNLLVRNNFNGNVTLQLYVNGALISSSANNIALNGTHTFSLSNLRAGEIITARALPTTGTLSNISNTVTVQPYIQPTSTPNITNTYTAGSNLTITGTSAEPNGTVITVFRNGIALSSTTTVTGGVWSLTGQTLVANDVLRAAATATGKTQSALSDPITVRAVVTIPTPSITGTYNVGATTISGTVSSPPAGSSLVVFVDGEEVARQSNLQTSTTNWSVTGLSSLLLYKGAVITARVENLGILGTPSANNMVLGASSFLITNQSDQPLNTTSYNIGDVIPIRIKARTGLSGEGSDFTGFNGKVSISSNLEINPNVSTNFVNGVWNGTVTFTTHGTANINVIATDDPTATGSASNLTINNIIYLWDGDTSTDFAVASNWTSNLVPPSGASIGFVDAPGNPMHINANRLFGTLDFGVANHTNKKVVVGNNTLEIRGEITNSGNEKSITTSSSSKLTLSGTSNAISVHFTNGSSLDELTINRNDNNAVTIASPVDVMSILRVSKGKLNSNGNITLKTRGIAPNTSENNTNQWISKTAVVPAVGGSIDGDVNVEQFIPGRRAFRFLTSTVTTSTSINANWQEGASNTLPVQVGMSDADFSLVNNNPYPNYGTHITGNANSLNGLDRTPSSNPSMFTFNNETQVWSSVTNTKDNTLVAGKPYRIMVRGDRSVNITNNLSLPNNTILRAKGTLFQNNYTIPSNLLKQTPRSYSFIANPYQARVNMREVLRNSDFFPRVWYWNPRIGNNGGYVSVDFLEESAEIVSVQGVQNTRIVDPFAAFFVRKKDISNTTSTITFREIHKLVEISNSAVFRNSWPSELHKLSITLHEMDGQLPSTNIVDGASIVFGPNYDSAFTTDDTGKFSNVDEDLAIYHGTSRVSIDKRNYPSIAEQINLGITKYRFTNYQFRFDLSKYFGITPYLLDNFTNTYTELTPGSNINYSFSVQTSNTETTSLDRFKIVFENQTLSTPQFNYLVTLYPNPSVDGSFTISTNQDIQNMKVVLYNNLGQEINLHTNLTTSNSLVCKPNVNLNSGVYIVELINENGRFTKKLIIK
jgi:hypothetical protein